MRNDPTVYVPALCSLSTACYHFNYRQRLFPLLVKYASFGVVSNEDDDDDELDGDSREDGEGGEDVRMLKTFLHF